MPDGSFRSRLIHAWDAFKSRDPTGINVIELGPSSYRRPDRQQRRGSNERSIVNAVYNRMAIDVAATSIRHVRTDENGMYAEDIVSTLNDCMITEANIDQTGRAFFQDVAMSLFDEGVIAVVPVETTGDPTESESYKIHQLRTGKILQWFPRHVQISLYNDQTGLHQNVTLPKKMVAIIENPLFAVMNEPNSTLQRLIRKLNLLDSIDEQSGSGKLDIIIQLPYVIKTEARRIQAEERRKSIEMQLSGSKYGIAYTDGTERVTQLNRPAENNLMGQIQYLTSMLFSQLGISESVFDGTADEATMLNYMNRSIEPILSAIIDEFKRKFLTKTARTQNQSIMYFRDIFKLVPAGELANMTDKFTRNEVMSPNDMRGIIGLKPNSDPKSNELRNRNINQAQTDTQHLDNSQIIQVFEALIRNPEVTETLDPSAQNILTEIVENIRKRAN